MACEPENVLAQFKDAIKSKVPDYNLASAPDGDLQKWLNARNNDIEAALEQFTKHLQFRKLHKLDEAFLNDYEPPEVLKKYYPGGLCGHCKDGFIVKYELPGKLDVKGLLMSVSDEEFLNHSIYTAEMMLEAVKKRQSETGDASLNKWTVVIDAEGFSVKQMSKSILERQKIITKIFEDNYPDRLHFTYIINCSRLFRLLLGIVKLTMDPSTFSKLTVLPHKEDLWKYIDKSQLPAKYGGAIKKDGLCEGGRIPEKYYQVERLLSATKDWPRIEVKAGTQESVDVEVSGAAMYLTWEFYTIKNRITFSLYHKADNKPDTPSELILNPYKPECCLCPETGSQDCQTPGKGIYTLVFGNLTSKLKSKTVVYSIQLLEKDKLDQSD